jgi:hypothetical protein
LAARPTEGSKQPLLLAREHWKPLRVPEVEQLQRVPVVAVPLEREAERPQPFGAAQGGAGERRGVPNAYETPM